MVASAQECMMLSQISQMHHGSYEALDARASLVDAEKDGENGIVSVPRYQSAVPR